MGNLDGKRVDGWEGKEEGLLVVDGAADDVGGCEGSCEGADEKAYKLPSILPITTVPSEAIVASP